MNASDLNQCESCGVWTSNADHICVEYDPAVPCTTCGAGTVFTTVAAPGTGSGRACANGHYDGSARELSRAEVV